MKRSTASSEFISIPLEERTQLDVEPVPPKAGGCRADLVPIVVRPQPIALNRDITKAFDLSKQSVDALQRANYWATRSEPQMSRFFKVENNSAPQLAPRRSYQEPGGDVTLKSCLKCSVF